MMDKQSSSDSNLSLDSLENEFKKKSHKKSAPSEQNVDTILVPFYENDVLIKVPKDQKRKQKQESSSKLNKEYQTSNSYLIKKETKKSKRTTYLEMFRKQFSPSKDDDKKLERQEVRSISPEYGDTERESFEDENNDPEAEFYNTESYNEIYYEKILNRETVYLDNSFIEDLQLEDKIGRSESPDGSADNNLKSVSEVSQPRRRMRRATVQPMQSVKLGGLGPDMEKIRPRLERARSLQRYSEKVRMENRLKIYKKSVQAELEKKAERETSARRRDSTKDVGKDDKSASYLVNKCNQEKTKKFILKSKSAGAERTRERNNKLNKDERPKKSAEERQDVKQHNENNASKALKSSDDKRGPQDVDGKVQSVKSSARNRGINTDKDSTRTKGIPPVQISFMVNVGGIRPSSALKTLEEKHRMYQEQVKAYTMNNDF